MRLSRADLPTSSGVVALAVPPPPPPPLVRPPSHHRARFPAPSPSPGTPKRSGPFGCAPGPRPAEPPAARSPGFASRRVARPTRGRRAVSPRAGGSTKERASASPAAAMSSARRGKRGNRENPSRRPGAGAGTRTAGAPAVRRRTRTRPWGVSRHPARDVRRSRKDHPRHALAPNARSRFGRLNTWSLGHFSNGGFASRGRDGARREHVPPVPPAARDAREDGDAPERLARGEEVPRREAVPRRRAQVVLDPGDGHERRRRGLRLRRQRDELQGPRRGRFGRFLPAAAGDAAVLLGAAP